jgi:hypothetical protein
MNKRSRPDYENNEAYRDWFFNLQPDSGDRHIQGFFIPAGDATTNVVNRLINISATTRATDDSSTLVIDASPDTQDGFVARNVTDGSRLMMKLVDFSATNAPMNIEPAKQNDKFWVWEDWNDSYVLPSTQTLWAGNMQEYTLPAAYYPDQQSLFDIMKEVTNGMATFVFNGAELVTYTGPKPIILPLSPNFSPAYYKAHNAVTVVDSVSIVPSNISGLYVTDNPAEFVISSSINGVSPQMNVLPPLNVLDYLAYKLGFLSASVKNEGLP